MDIEGLRLVSLIDIKEIPIHVLNLEDIHSGELSENTMRKNFTFSEMVEVKKYLAQKEREDALERQELGQKLGGSDIISVAKTVITSLVDFLHQATMGYLKEKHGTGLPNILI